MNKKNTTDLPTVYGQAFLVQIEHLSVIQLIQLLMTILVCIYNTIKRQENAHIVIKDNVDFLFVRLH